MEHAFSYLDPPSLCFSSRALSANLRFCMGRKYPVGGLWMLQRLQSLHCAVKP